MLGQQPAPPAASGHAEQQQLYPPANQTILCQAASVASDLGPKLDQLCLGLLLGIVVAIAHRQHHEQRENHEMGRMLDICAQHNKPDWHSSIQDVACTKWQLCWMQERICQTEHWRQQTTHCSCTILLQLGSSADISDYSILALVLAKHALTPSTAD